jgi:hypothetical protein
MQYLPMVNLSLIILTDFSIGSLPQTSDKLDLTAEKHAALSCTERIGILVLILPELPVADYSETCKLLRQGNECTGSLPHAVYS